jgi:hypothetical protein
MAWDAQIDGDECVRCGNAFTPEHPRQQPLPVMGTSANLGIRVDAGRVVIGPVHADASWCGR